MAARCEKSLSLTRIYFILSVRVFFSACSFCLGVINLSREDQQQQQQRARRQRWTGINNIQ
jgi:preprotein translocase subunit SecG